MEPSGAHQAATITLAEVMRRLDVGLLRHLAGPAPADVAVASVGIGDPAGPLGPSDGILLVPGLGVGPDSPASVVVDLLACGVPAVVVRGEAVPEWADGATCLLGIDPAITWDRAFLLLSAALDGALGALAAGPDAASQRMGDLFALADAVAGSVEGNVLLLDAQNRVLAFSSGQEEPTDEWRRDTILGRQVPHEWQQRFRREGLYDRIAVPGQVVTFELPDTPGFLPRRAVGVHAGGRRIGTIAVAQGNRPFDGETDAALREASRMAALPLLRYATRELVGAHRQDERLRELLGGTSAPASAVARLGLPTGGHFCVAAMARRGSPEPEWLEGMAQRVRMAVPQGLDAVVVVDGPRLYLLCAGGPDQLAALVAQPRWFTATPAAEAGLLAGVARPVGTPHGITAARDEADRVLDAMLAGVVDMAVASPESSWPRVALHEIQRLMRTDEALRYGRAAVLAAHDRSHGADYVATLAAYLAHRGDTAVCAAALHVHPNTLRYRIRRACAIADIDLDDPVERLVVELQLTALLAGG